MWNHVISRDFYNLSVTTVDKSISLKYVDAEIPWNSLWDLFNSPMRGFGDQGRTDFALIFLTRLLLECAPDTKYL